MTKRTDIRQSNKVYKEGQIVYPSIPNNFYYVCIQEGRTQAENEGLSGNNEPTWNNIGMIEDRALIWRPIPHDSNPSVQHWEPNKLYHLGDKVHPISNSYVGLYSYILQRIIAEPDWPIVLDATIEDGTVIWKAKISTHSFIPKELSSDELHTEFSRIVDYLLTNKILYLDDTIYKFKDRSRIQVDALQAFVTEQGYKYIVEVLNLTKDQLETLTEYLNLIHFLKGTRYGLELVLSLLGIIAEIKEWWEEETPTEAHTFTLDLDFNLGNIKRDSVARIASFCSHYVFPKLREIIINYEAKIAGLETFITGVPDQDYLIESGSNVLLNLTTYLHIETTYLCITVIPEAKLLLPTPGKVLILPNDKAWALP
jgi:hypothetical protein